MKLLITTQKVDSNDPDLGFFYSWIIEFAKHFEFVTVICLEEGVHKLPQNVKVLSLGKEKSNEANPKWHYALNFIKYAFQERNNYDLVFVHMNQIYVILGGLFWKAMGKKINLWYTHRAVSPSLRIAAVLSDKIFTASRASFNIQTNKLNVVGHGIDIKKFSGFRRNAHAVFSLLSVGRITRIKNLDTLIQAAAILKDQGMNFSCEIVGPCITPDDNVYLEELKNLVKENNLGKYVKFRDAVSNEKISDYYVKSDVNVNLTPTGGIDKVVLEGILAGALPLASNPAFTEVFGPYADRLIFKFRDPQNLALKIKSLYEKQDKDFIRDLLERKVRLDFSLESLIQKMSEIMVR